MSIAAFVLLLTIGIAVAALAGWFFGRSSLNLLRTELAKERAVHAERLKTYADAESKLRDAFQAMSADALQTNNEAFLTWPRRGCARRAPRRRPTSTRARRRSRICSRR